MRGWFRRWQRGNRGDRAAGEEWSLHAPVTATPVAIADTTPHAKSPFVALDRKLLFVRRLRGEFSDDETRSFRTRYSSGLRRYRWERESRTNVVTSRVCFAFFFFPSVIQLNDGLSIKDPFSSFTFFLKQVDWDFLWSYYHEIDYSRKMTETLVGIFFQILPYSSMILVYFMKLA